MNRRRLRALFKDKLALVGLAIALLFVLTAVLAPVIAPYDPATQRILKQLDPPSQEHLLGLDEYGRDVLSRVIWGGRVSLTVGLSSVLLGLLIGLPLGAVSAFLGGWFDEAVMRVADVLLAFPTLLLALTVIAALGPGTNNVILAIGIAMIPFFARLARSQTLELREIEFVDAARALGSSKVRVLWRYILPNIIGPIVVSAAIQLAFAIRTEAGISFLGLGVSPPTPTWGNMISEGRSYLQFAPWVATSAGTAIMLVILAFNLFGDALRDVVDPRLRK
ncbi:MAG: ABC transporter permease [Trueperaceae bacterium]|nr:ABC transporter permease [Trueperaceae bacterium]